MKVDWQTLRDHYKGQMVGGELIIRQNKVNRSCGRLRQGVFNWTPYGLQLAESFIPPRVVAASPLPAPVVKRRPGRPRKAKVEEVAADAKVGDQEL